ncbi:MAG: hypothetical protein KC417_08440 [Myxococcales bacterium]|nr:hypothetical protein [Myxococcales bacterium]
MRASMPVAGALAALAFVSACDRGMDPSEYDFDPVDYPPSAGRVCGGERVDLDASSMDGGSADDAGAPIGCLWQSSDWRGDDWVEYPGRATVRFPHGLGRVPTSVLVYIAFHASGEGGALSAGDLSRVVDVTADYVELQNDTNATYFCRIVVE